MILDTLLIEVASGGGAHSPEKSSKTFHYQCVYKTNHCLKTPNVREAILTRLRLPEEARAIDLYERLNRRYFQFADQLPPLLRHLAHKRSTFLGGPEDEGFEGVSGLNPVLASTPWLFWETFCELDDERFLAIAEAGTMFVLASIVLDHIVDGHAEPLKGTALLHQALYEHGITVYRKTFPSSSSFWANFNRLASDHLAGLAKELEAQSNVHRMHLEDMIQMAHGKVSPIVTTIAALVEALGRPEVLRPIEASLKYIAVASQMLDDVGDWEDDINTGHFTYYLSCLMPSEVWEKGSEPSVDDLRSILEAGWTDVEHLRWVVEWLDHSIEAVRGMDCPAWIEYVDGYRKRTDENMTAAVARHLMEKLRPIIPPPHA